MTADAKEYCTKTWDCKGQHRCSLDCKNRYNGTATCRPPFPPAVRDECLCVWNC
ncbi:hypothetical protein LINGRAHAP2_LOCUS13193 [Linum grandiflorum]